MTPDFWSIFIVLAMTHADGQAFVLHDQVQSFAQDKSVHDHHPRHPAGRAGELSSEPHICAQYARLLSESGKRATINIMFCLVTDYERKFVLGVATRQDLEVVFCFLSFITYYFAHPLIQSCFATVIRLAARYLISVSNLPPLIVCHVILYCHHHLMSLHCSLLGYFFALACLTEIMTIHAGFLWAGTSSCLYDDRSRAVETSKNTSGGNIILVLNTAKISASPKPGF